MATSRVSRLHQSILRVLLAEHHRTRGRTTMAHLEFVKALGRDQSNISRSLRILEARGWLVIDRTVGGRAASLHLTLAGLAKASEIYA